MISSHLPGLIRMMRRSVMAITESSCDRLRKVVANADASVTMSVLHYTNLRRHTSESPRRIQAAGVILC